MMRNESVTKPLIEDLLAKWPIENAKEITWGRSVVAILVLIVCTWLYYPYPDEVSAPFSGSRHPFEPRTFLKFRYNSAAMDLINDGYAKWKDSMYKLSRHDGDLVVLSRKYVSELHNIPIDRLSSIKGLIKNFGGRYSGIAMLSESDIGTHAIQSRITPNLTSLSEVMRDELEYALEKEMENCDDWTSILVQPLFLRIVGRITNRVLIGLPICRDEKWLNITSKHAHNVTMTQIIIRSVPLFVRPILNFLLPSFWKYKFAVYCGKRMLVPEIIRRCHLEKTDPDYEKPNDLLQGMIDLSTPGSKDSEVGDLAHRQLIITLVAGHSTAAAGAHALFDLVARPECFGEIRQEILDVLKDEGGSWEKQSLSKLQKMDSFLRESQRMNPPSLLGFHRLVEDPAGITLHDGTHLPYRTHLCIAPHSISSDPDLVIDPDSFNGFRYYEERQKTSDDASKHHHTTVDKIHMHFGYGTWSCPGRFLASDELKMILAALLLRYEFRFPKGASRPQNKNIQEFPYTDIDTHLLLRRRLDCAR